jgi:peptidoglycan/LPS O-acetylase OafA/YrhL
MNANQWAIGVACVVLSLLAAFFLVFNGLFTDGPEGMGHPERLVSFGLILAGYGLLGATSARLARPWWAWPVVLALPALAVCALYAARESGTAVVARAIVEAIVVLIGVLLGAWLAKPRGPAARPPAGRRPAGPPPAGRPIVSRPPTGRPPAGRPPT